MIPTYELRTYHFQADLTAARTYFCPGFKINYYYLHARRCLFDGHEIHSNDTVAELTGAMAKVLLAKVHPSS